MGGMERRSRRNNRGLFGQYRCIVVTAAIDHLFWQRRDIDSNLNQACLGDAMQTDANLIAADARGRLFVSGFVADQFYSTAGHQVRDLNRNHSWTATINPR